jgi:NAD(P)-dependent dehydrogenase (short-subunit alcohol dehydrogenase family)
LASRYALNTLTKMMALELRALGVIAVALWPGYLRTEMNHIAVEAMPPEEALPQVVSLIDQLTWDHTGCFMPDGKVFAW